MHERGFLFPAQQLALVCPAVLQAEDEADVLDQRTKNAYGSSFRTFDATDYKPIGRRHFLWLQPDKDTCTDECGPCLCPLQPR